MCEKKNNSYTSALFGRSIVNIESMSSTASKTNDIVNAIRDRLNNVVDVVEEILEKFNNNPSHASLAM